MLALVDERRAIKRMRDRAQTLARVISF